MGVKVKLADRRVLDGKEHKAGDVVEVDEGSARALARMNLASVVDGDKSRGGKRGDGSSSAGRGPAAAGSKSDGKKG